MSAQPSEVGVGTLLRLPAVCGRTGLKKTQLYALMKAERFPRSIKLSARTTAWSSRAIDAWISERLEASKGDAAT